MITKTVREKINKFLILNSDDKELMDFFKNLIKKNPVEFGFPDLTKELKTLPSFIHGKLKQQAKTLLHAPKSIRVKTVMRLLYENQLNNVYDNSLEEQINKRNLDKKEKERIRVKSIHKTYDQVPISESYFRHSLKEVEDWEKDKDELNKNLIRLRNKER